jgi:hypothetical protein
MTWFRNNPGKLKPKALEAPICKTSRRDHPSQKRTPRGLTKRSMAGSFWQGFGTGLRAEPHQRQGRLKQAKKRFEQAWSAFASPAHPFALEASENLCYRTTNCQATGIFQCENNQSEELSYIGRTRFGRGKIGNRSKFAVSPSS